MKYLPIIFLLAFHGLGAQPLPKIALATLSLSEGEKEGFVMRLPGVDPDLVLSEWKAFTYLMFPPVQPGEDQPRPPVTTEVDGVDREYHTTGLYWPNLCQHTVDAYLLIEPLGAQQDTLAVQPTTRFSLAIDFGNDNFLDTDDGFLAALVKHLMNMFFVNVAQTITGRPRGNANAPARMEEAPF